MMAFASKLVITFRERIKNSKYSEFQINLKNTCIFCSKKQGKIQFRTYYLLTLKLVKGIKY